MTITLVLMVVAGSTASSGAAAKSATETKGAGSPDPAVESAPAGAAADAPKTGVAPAGSDDAKQPAAAAGEEAAAAEGTPGAAVESAADAAASNPAPTRDGTDVAMQAAAAARRRIESEAAFLHAGAIEAELDGDYRRALERLRAAVTLLPEDGLLAFDLARVALLRGGTDADLELFWRLSARSESRSPDEEQLLGAVALRLHRQPAAAEPLVDLPDWLHARLRTGVEIDTNVSILPEDQPSQQLGVRYAIDGLVLYRPLRDWLAVDAGVLFRLGKYLNDSGQLGLYDANTFALLAGLRLDLDWVLLGARASGTQLLSGGFTSQYAQMLALELDARLPTGGGHFGAYFGARAQDFAAGNADGDVDRDGGQVSAGLVWDWAGESFSTRGKFGWMRQFAAGAKQRIQSIFVDVSARLDIAPVSASVGLRDDVRLYDRVSLLGLADDPNLRVDNRLTPFAEVSVALWEMIGVYAGYSFTANLSTSESDNIPDERYDYLRHLVHVGVEGRL